MENPIDRYVIVTTRAGQRRAFTLDAFRLLAEEYSFMVSHAEHVDKLPEGVQSPTPILDAGKRGLLP